MLRDLLQFCQEGPLTGRVPLESEATFHCMVRIDVFSSLEKLANSCSFAGNRVFKRQTLHILKINFCLFN